jgi:hypothetical protein
MPSLRQDPNREKITNFLNAKQTRSQKCLSAIDAGVQLWGGPPVSPIESQLVKGRTKGNSLINLPLGYK